MLNAMFGLVLWVGLFVFIHFARNLRAEEGQYRHYSTIMDHESIHSAKLIPAFQRLSRSTVWNLTDTLPLKFNTYHPQGMAITQDHIFLSSVDIIEPTKMYPHSHKNGLDRTPGKGVGHLFVLNKDTGLLEKDIRLVDGEENHKYHPGGIDYDGTYIYVPLAQYRPFSSASIYRVHAQTLEIDKLFDTNDHYGGLIHNRESGTLIGNNWGSRNFTEWTLKGRVLRKWVNPNWFIDYQDGQYVSPGKLITSGTASVPQSPAAVASLGSAAIYELGGVALIDLKTTNVEWEIPLQIWSQVGHVITRNPFKMGVMDGKLAFWAAPDDGTENGGTKILTYISDVGID